MNESVEAEHQQILRVMKTIREIMRANNLAGYMFLGGPEVVSFAVNFDPDWCKLEMQQNDEGGVAALRLQSKNKDYKGDADAQRKDLESTMGLLREMGVQLGESAMEFLKASQFLEPHVGVVEHRRVILKDPKE